MKRRHTFAYLRHDWAFRGPCSLQKKYYILLFAAFEISDEPGEETCGSLGTCTTCHRVRGWGSAVQGGKGLWLFSLPCWGTESWRCPRARAVGSWWLIARCTVFQLTTLWCSTSVDSQWWSSRRPLTPDLRCGLWWGFLTTAVKLADPNRSFTRLL